MIATQPIYNPLYTDKEHFIILVTGGRASGKSFNLSAFNERLTFEKSEDRTFAHTILYTRYTMVSAHMSIIPEMMEKIDLDVTGKYFRATKTDIINARSGGKIMFRGIKTSSGNQTAKLKSIHGITTFVCDEAEEWTDESDFDKIMLSIRQKGIQNRIIIIMNPTDSNHFIYQKYIRDTHKLVEIDGVLVQISTHPNVLHIHTTYLDNIDHLSDEFLKEVRRMKEEDPEKYAHTVIGRWSDVAEGAIYKKWGVVKGLPGGLQKIAIGVDFGFTHDPTSIVMCGVKDDSLYIDELCYRTGMLSRDIIAVLKRFPDIRVIADSADPRLIQEIANAGIRIYPVEKGTGSIIAGIEKVKEYNMYVTERSYNTMKELRNYVWDKDKDGHTAQAQRQGGQAARRDGGMRGGGRACPQPLRAGHMAVPPSGLFLVLFICTVAQFHSRSVGSNNCKMYISAGANFNYIALVETQSFLRATEKGAFIWVILTCSYAVVNKIALMIVEPLSPDTTPDFLSYGKLGYDETICARESVLSTCKFLFYISFGIGMGEKPMFICDYLKLGIRRLARHYDMFQTIYPFAVKRRLTVGVCLELFECQIS